MCHHRNQMPGYYMLKLSIMKKANSYKVYERNKDFNPDKETLNRCLLNNAFNLSKNCNA
jgi:hypothetical protein